MSEKTSSGTARTQSPGALDRWFACLETFSLDHEHQAMFTEATEELAMLRRRLTELGRALANSAATMYATRLKEARAIIESQAEDAGLWFEAATAPEAYLQQALRELHAAVEAGPDAILTGADLTRAISSLAAPEKGEGDAR